MIGANGGQDAGIGKCEDDQLFHHTQNQLGSRGDGEFFEKPVHVRVDGMPRNAESPGNSRLGEIVKNTLDDLQLALRDAQGAGNFKPGVVGKQCGSPQLGS